VAELAYQQGKVTITKVIDHKFQMVGRFFVEKYLCV